MYQSSADFSGWLSMMGKSSKTFDMVVYTKSVFFLNFDFFCGGGGAAARQPHPLGAPLLLQ